tara:strand:+ start:4984 stop:6756 length:1773 start_codon:yes stop_codon:yes gene_type:complete
MKKSKKKTTSGVVQNSVPRFINLGTYTSPEIVEEQNNDFVKYGADNNYFGFLNDLFNGSPTNSAAINGIAQLIAGRGVDALDSNQKPNEYATMKKLFTDECLSRLAIDLKLFGQASLQVIYNADHSKVVQAEHYPVETLRAEKCSSESGDIEAYYYSPDWSQVKNGDELKRIPAFGFSNEDIEILYIKPYKSGYYYYSPVDYQGATQYIEMESEISNFHLNSLLNGMAPSMLMNMNSGIPDEDTQREIENKIYQKYTGTSNAGRIILAFNNNADEQATVETIQLSDAHQQYQFLSEESSQKIIIGHRITSPLLLGINKSTGFSSNSDELRQASILFDNTVIAPFQDLILKAFDSILAYNEMSLKLYVKTLQPLEFVDLTNANNTEEVEEQTGQKRDFSDERPKLTDEIAKALLDRLENLGEEEDLDDWELIDSTPANEYDDNIHSALSLASVVSSTPSQTSEQDTSILKVRYAYMGSNNPERDFCQKMWAAKKIYRKEDLDKQSSDNSELSPSGSSTYNIWLYKGGVNCKHYWERRTYLRKNNQKITVTEARRRINELDPSLRKEAEIEKNAPEVAQIAKSSNDYWRYNN